MIFTLRRRPEPELIKLLLDSGIDVNETGEKGSLYEGVTFLMVALTMPQNTYFKESPYEVIKLLIDYGADVNTKNPNGATTLMRAAYNRDLEVLKLLIASGAEINAKNNEGYTALMAAAYRGDYESVKFFLSLGADVSAKDITGRTALIEVMNNLNYISILDGIKTIRLLISSGAEVNLKALDEGIWTSGNGECYRTPLMMAVNYNKTFYDAMEEVCPLPEIVEFLLNADAKINEVDSEGNTALMLAVQVNNPDCKVIETLLDAGADVNVECNGLRAVDYARRNPKLVGTEIFKRLESMTKPLSYKRHANASEMLEFIYKNLADELKAVIADGANVNEREKEGGWTILMSAVHSEEVDLEIIKILLESGAEINAIDEFHETALKKAVYNQYNEKSLDVIKLLIDAGADINAANDEGWTPLMEAAYHNNPDIVKLLVDCGADVNIERKGLRAIDYAYGNKLMANTQALKKLEAMTARRDNHRKITDDEFVEICEIGSLQQIEKALKAGANADARDSMGATMLMNAVSDHDSPNPELIKLLLNYGADVNARDYNRSVLMQAVHHASIQEKRHIS